MDKTRCHWFDESNEIISKYHDEEFGILNIDDDYLFEILVLVNFQTGLSWEIMLKKREDFRIAFDGFDVEKIACYDENRMEELLKNEVTKGNDVLVFSVSSGLSSTYNTIRLVAEEINEESIEIGRNNKIRVIDTKSISAGISFLVSFIFLFSFFYIFILLRFGPK